eukprot:7319318-Pyramimonas_sp.AAC.1
MKARHQEASDARGMCHLPDPSSSISSWNGILTSREMGPVTMLGGPRLQSSAYSGGPCQEPPCSPPGCPGSLGSRCFCDEKPDASAPEFNGRPGVSGLRFSLQ